MRILCVDDDRLVLAVTADLLRALGHDVIEAAGGSEAVQAIERDDPFDMIVTDIHMPGDLSGPELAEMGRARHPGLPVVFFSGLSHVVPVDVGSIVLRKPCSLGELQQAIDSMTR